MISKKCFWWLLGGLVFLFIGSISFLFIYLPYQIFDHVPMEFPEKQLDMTAMTSLSAKIQTMMPQIMNSKPDDTLTLELTEKEANTIILFTENGQSYQDVLAGHLDLMTKTNKPYSISFSDGNFNILIKHRLALLKVFDEYMNIKIIAHPYIKDGKVQPNLKFAKVGNLSISGNLLQRYFDEEMQNVNATNEYKMLSSLIKEIKITEDNELHITFKPFKLKQMMMQFLLK